MSSGINYYAQKNIISIYIGSNMIFSLISLKTYYCNFKSHSPLVFDVNVTKYPNRNSEAAFLSFLYDLIIYFQIKKKLCEQLNQIDQNASCF